MSPPLSMSWIGCWQAVLCDNPARYKQMLAWMRAFGSLQRVGIEATGTYGAGLLRYMQKTAIM